MSLYRGSYFTSGEKKHRLRVHWCGQTLHVSIQFSGSLEGSAVLFSTAHLSFSLQRRQANNTFLSGTVCLSLSLLLLQNMPSLGCVQGFGPRFDLDTTEHDLRTDPSMSQQLLDYLSRGESQVSDRAPRPVIRPTAAAEPPRCVPTGPDAYFHRCVKFDFPASESLLIYSIAGYRYMGFKANIGANCFVKYWKKSSFLVTTQLPFYFALIWNLPNTTFNISYNKLPLFLKCNAAC